MRNILMVVTALVVMTFWQPWAAASDQHSYSNPEHIKVTHLDLALTVDFEARQLRGVVELHLQHLDDNASQLKLDSKDLAISSVEQRVGATWQAARWRRVTTVAWALLAITLLPTKQDFYVIYGVAMDRTHAVVDLSGAVAALPEGGPIYTDHNDLAVMGQTGRPTVAVSGDGTWHHYFSSRPNAAREQVPDGHQARFVLGRQANTQSILDLDDESECA